GRVGRRRLPNEAKEQTQTAETGSCPASLSSEAPKLLSDRPLPRRVAASQHSRRTCRSYSGNGCVQYPCTLQTNLLRTSARYKGSRARGRIDSSPWHAPLEDASGG